MLQLSIRCCNLSFRLRKDSFFLLATKLGKPKYLSRLFELRTQSTLVTILFSCVLELKKMVDLE
ncbi:hypothetical protein F383_00979 [Gossypium arboreum]|uniref:Uncharacterized protein n=1 Tax=Gossypium arboreum TaxID=29729 RepID=A0A0B0P5Q3_GOSAR|nr:hypothetical protein F383_00979 [Gossypium arboreum]